ncbi:MAG: hypothetical protein QOH68_1178, partial [Nocardioidaceae bacterium]|nr:hypothetical protein [Nocardioidaceae bacterium]
TDEDEEFTVLHVEIELVDRWAILTREDASGFFECY